MEGQGLLLQTLVYLGAGVIAAPIAKRLGLGSVLGYLIAGIIIGPFALSLVGEQADVMRFAEFGVVILLFMIGLEVRPALLWSMRKTIFGLGGAQVVLTAMAIGGASLLLGLDWKIALAVGLVLSMSSTAIVLQTLDEKGLRQGPVGRAAFGVLLLQDLAVIPLFALLPLLAAAPVHLVAEAADHAGGHGGSLIAGLPAWLQTLAVLSAVAAVVGGGRYVVQPVFRFIAQSRLREIFTATALLIVVGVAALMQTVGLSPALGAFLAGVVLAESEYRRELETDIEPFRGLLLGLFFITVGAGINFPLLLSSPGLILALVAALALVKAAVLLVLGRLFRLAPGDNVLFALALAQGGEFAFVLFSFASANRVLPASLTSLLVVVVALSMLVTPLVLMAHERWLAPLLLARAPQRPADAIESDEGAVIIAGFGRFGQIVGRLLLANRFPITVLDHSPTQIDLLRRFGWRVFYGDASRLDLLHAAGAERARLLVVAVDEPSKSLEIVELARKHFPGLEVLARAFDRQHAQVGAEGCRFAVPIPDKG
jgi:glutathione-regulated potassium-efflux system ancillary protein KefC/glutathione-regulated potassium-efflux system protein KefB